MRTRKNFENITVNREGFVTTVVLNRPEKHNALNRKILSELGDVFDHIRKAPETRVVIITGAGEKAFCVGADLTELQNVTYAQAVDFLECGQRVMETIHSSPVPVIAAINGYALGGGMELATACHLRIASESAQFALPEVKLGMIPAFGGSQRLPRLIGYAKAAEMILTGRRVSASEAFSIGLVNQVCTPSAIMQAAHELARTIADHSPVSVEMILYSLRSGTDIPLERGLLVERLAGAAAASSLDQRQGVQAFLEKKTPTFKGWRTGGNGGELL